MQIYSTSHALHSHKREIYSRATLVGLGQANFNRDKIRTSRRTVIISKQVICTVIFKSKTLYVKSVHLEEGIVSRLKFALAKSYQSGSIEITVLIS